MLLLRLPQRRRQLSPEFLVRLERLGPLLNVFLELIALQHTQLCLQFLEAWQLRAHHRQEGQALQQSLEDVIMFLRIRHTS